MIKNVIISILLFFWSSKIFAYDVTVAQDGSGNYTTVQAAVNAAPTGLTAPYTIFIKNGKYREKITIPSNKPFLQMIGESVANVFVYYDDCAGTAGGTSASASFTINANDFSAFNITFANTFDYDAGVLAGISGLQAVAVLVNGDRVAFKSCRFIGEQDTLYQNKKGFYKNCYIDGIIDFIFGGGASVFEECTIIPKSRTGNGTSYITAANTPAGQAYGYVFRDSKIINNPGGTNYYLGRPWQNSTGSSVPFAENKTVLINTVLNANVLGAGWSVWDAGTITGNITYAEYQSKFFNNTPIDISNRVAWSQQLDATQAVNYTNTNIFAAGTSWDPCATYTTICNTATPEIAIANFKGTKGVGTATFKWNLSWGINNVKMELFRSLIRSGSYTKIGEITTPNDTTYHFNITDNALPPGQDVYYYLYNTATGYNSTYTDTIKISTKPTINTVGSLGAFLQGGGVPSASQNYTVNGVNLSDNVVIVPPANFEISLNNATWINSTGNITLTPTSGVLSNTIIYVRMNASTAPGTFSGNIVHTTTNGDNVQLPVSGTSQIAALTPPAFFRSKATGNLSDVNTWETSADSTAWFAAATVPNGAPEENITLMPGYTVTIDVAHTVNGKWTVYGTGANVGGAITIGAIPGALTFANNSTLVWNRDGGTLPTGTIFNAGSTFNLTGTGNGVAFGGSSTLPTINTSQVFHHVVINTPNCKTNNPNFGTSLNTINGNLTVLSTGAYGYKMRLSNSATQVINIGGDLIVNPPLGSHATFVLYSTSTIATTQAVNVAGNIYVGNNYVTNITGTNGTFTTSSTAVTLNAANPSIVVGMGVTGTGIAANSWVTAVSGTSLTLSTTPSSAGTNVALTFVQATSNLTLSDAGAAIPATGAVTLGSPSITLTAANASIAAGMNISGTGIPAGTTVAAISGTNLTLSNNATATGASTSLTITNTLSKTNLKGNLTINNGTIAVNGNGLGTINIAGNTGIPQYFNRTAGTLPSTFTMNVLPNAILDVNTSVLPSYFNLNAGGTLRTAAAGGILTNITNGGRVFSSAANYVFNGTIAQSANNNFTTTTPSVLTVNSIAINNTAGVTLGNSLTTSSLNLTAGKLTLGAANLTTNSINGGNASNFVITDAAGKLKINNIGATPITFPVGPNTTSYNPVTISNSGTFTADNYSVTVAPGSPAGVNLAPQLDSAINRTWNISEDIVGGSNATVTLQWDVAQQNSLFNNNYCAVVHSNGTSIDFSGIYAASSANGSSFTQTGSGFTSFSPFGVASTPIIALPLQLVNFTGSLVNKNTQLTWTTTNEINVSKYEIERSNNGVNFVKITTQTAKNQTTNIYTYQDVNTPKGKNYYRLKMLDKDGSFKYSNIVVIQNNFANNISISPNPASDFIKIKLPDLSGYTITLLDVNGKKIVEEHTILSELRIPIVTLHQGVYFIKIQNKDEMTTQKIIKQ